MPTVRTVTVKSSGGDYTSLGAAEAGEQGDLVSLDRQLDIECYALNDTTEVIILGWTTDATRYINIFTATGQGHSGVWDTSKYRLSTALALTRVLSIQEEFVRVTGLQLEHTNATASNRRSCVQIIAGTSDMLLDRLLTRNGGNSGSFQCAHTGGTVTIRNTIIIGTNGHPGVLQSSTGTTVCQNVTSVGAGTYGFRRGAGTMTLTNCYSGGNTTDAYEGTITRTTSAHDTATVFAGSTASIAYDTSNFSNVTAGTEDLHLASGSDLIDAGTDLSGTFTVDIDNVARSGTWDIGADEFVAAATGNPWCYYAQCR